MRDDKGRFIKGTTGNPAGRPKKATEAEYHDVLLDVVPLERWRKILEALVKRAERGDIQAFTALANRILPIVTKSEHSGIDGNEIIFRVINETSPK